MEKRSLRGQVTILFNILRLLAHGDAKSISEIADEIGIQHRTASNYAKLLYELGFVNIKYEGPRLLVKITEKGLCIVKCLEKT